MGFFSGEMEVDEVPEVESRIVSIQEAMLLGKKGKQNQLSPCNNCEMNPVSCTTGNARALSHEPYYGGAVCLKFHQLVILNGRNNQ